VDKAKAAFARALDAVLAAVLLHGLARLAFKALRYLQSPYSRDYGEGCVLAMVQLLHEKGTYFTSLADYPFVHGNYPPVFIAMVWPFYAAFGPSILTPRVLSLVSTLALAGALFLLLERVAGNRRAAAIFTALSLAPWFVQTWAPMGRVDMLALALSTAGLAWIARGGRTGAAFPFFWLAFFTKQNVLLAPAALLLHVALEGPPARAARAIAVFTVPLLALFAVLAALTHGESYRHLVPYTAAASYEWGRMAASYLELALIAAPLLALVVWAGVRGPRPFASGLPRLIFIYWVLNLAALATIAKAGAAQNYFIEPWLATVLVAAAAVHALGEGDVRRPVMALVLAASGVAVYAYPEGHKLPVPIRHPENARDFRELWETVRASPGPVLSENLVVLVANDKPVLLEPFGMLLLAQKGLVDLTPLLRDCEAGRFPLIVAEHRLEEIEGLGGCLAARYEPWKDLATYRLFRPKAAATH
jgi:hypothetical protein